MSLSDYFQELLDPETRKHVIELIHKWINLPESYPPEKAIEKINGGIVEPLEYFLEKEYKAGKWVEGHEGWGKMNPETGEYDQPGPWIDGRWVGNWTSGTEAAINFQLAAEEIIYRFKHCLPIEPDMWEPYISILNGSWEKFQSEMGWGAVCSLDKTKREVDLLRPPAKKWARHMEYVSEGGKKKATPPYIVNQWIEEAKRLKKKNSSLSKRSIATMIAQNEKIIGDRIETIRRKI